MDAVYLWLSDWTELLIVVALVYFRNKKKTCCHQVSNPKHIAWYGNMLTSKV